MSRRSSSSWLIKLFHLCALLSIANADFYRLLGVSKSATKKEIKSAYRKKSLEFHPDKNKEEGAAEKFAEINRAYEVLSDEETRKIYDRHGEEGLKQHEQRGGGGGYGGGSPFDDFFGFGQRQRRNQEQRTPSVDIPLELTLEQLYKGETFEVSYVRQVLCLRWEMCMKPNQECQGPGVRSVRQQIAPGFVQSFQQRDDRCVAPGKMWLTNCSECPKQTEAEKIDLTIDVNKGARHMEAITFDGVADEKPGYKPGDLSFIINELPHKDYHRDGDHLYKTMSVPLVDSLTGFTITLQHLDGEKFSVAVDDVIECDEVLRVPGKGMPRRSGRGFGDLFITFEVNFPEALSADQKTKLREVLGGASSSGSEAEL